MTCLWLSGVAAGLLLAGLASRLYCPMPPAPTLALVGFAVLSGVALWEAMR